MDGFDVLRGSVEIDFWALRAIVSHEPR